MHDSVEDLTQLKQLDAHSVRRCLYSRYKQKLFYTWAGPTLVALNPLRELPELYSKKIMDLFAHETFTYNNPHIFALGQRSLRHLQWGIGKTHQAIVVNGESGAGKTCSALYLLSYFAAMETNNNDTEKSDSIEVLLCKSNPLLEALGNAQTLRNENSSRFGKLIRLLYSGEGAGTELKSANIETYLLESTRVSKQATGERNFHIFYQILVGLPCSVKEQLGLTSEFTWSIASATDCNSVDEAEFKNTMTALKELQLGDVIPDLWKILAALLHLGNITFSAIENHKSSWRTDQTQHLDWAAKLLGLKSDDLLTVFTVRNIQAGSKAAVLRPCETEGQCSARRDTLIRLLYRLVFDLVLQRVNKKLGNAVHSSRNNLKYLCILDLYGFESFEHGNSLEQLCINYANERLQYYFTINYLKEQTTHLTQEGLTNIDLDVNILDKQNLISFLDGPVSVFGVLNEECYLNRGCDDSQVCLRIQASLNERTKGVKSMPPSPRTPRSNSRAPPVQFAIAHYADLVTYSTVSMLDKNRDYVPAELVALLSRSASSFVRLLVGNELTTLNTTHTMNGRRHTVLAKFKNSVDNLMKILNLCDIHYVRCIRPTLSAFCSSPSANRFWDDDYVDAQLNACGVIDTIRVSSFGFPIRMTHEDFATRYRFLATGPHHRAPSCSVEDLCRRIVESHSKLGKLIRVGNFQVYATEQGVELAERWKHLMRQQAASLIQSWWRHHVQRKQAALAIQSWWRTTRRSRAARRIQSWWRRKRSNEIMLAKLSQLCCSIRVVQRTIRRWLQRKKAVFEPVPELPATCQLDRATAPSPIVKEPTIQWPTSPFYSAKLHNSFSLISLQLSRTDFFYSDGVISIRRPSMVRPRLIIRKTCLPFSYVVPRSQMPLGLVDAL